MKLIELASAITSLFPFMILENFGSVTSLFYHLHRNETMYKLVYISRHVDLLRLGNVLKASFVINLHLLKYLMINKILTNPSDV